MSTTITDNETPPAWMLIVRDDDDYHAYFSFDGAYWDYVTTATVDLSDSVLYGMAATSGDAIQTAKSEFGFVSLNPLSSDSGDGGEEPETFQTPEAFTDIGTQTENGDIIIDESTETIRLEGKGGNIWNDSDDFHFAYSALAGDGEMIVRIDSMAYTHDWSKAGLMFREDLTAESKNVTALFHGNNRVYQGFRETQGEATQKGDEFTTAGAPIWLRLVRQDNVFQAFYSMNGEDWNFISETYVEMGTNIYAGLAYTSRSSSNFGYAEFSNYSLIPYQYTNLFTGDWTTSDVGTVGASGEKAYSIANDYFRLTGKGENIWEESDDFHFVHQDVQGDVDVVVKVEDFANTHSWAKFGLMVREDMADTSKHASVLFHPNGLLDLYFRDETGGLTDRNSQVTSLEAPLWLRLSRTGDEFRGYHSTDGQNWVHFGTETLSMSESAKVGFVYTSRNEDLAGFVNFSSLSFYPWVSQHWDDFQSDDIGDVAEPGFAQMGNALNETFSITSWGYDITGNTDNVHLWSIPADEDGVFTVTLEDVQYTHFNAKAGLMIRSSLEEGSPSLSVYGTPRPRTRSAFRSSPNASPSYSPDLDIGQNPHLRIVRYANGTRAATFYSLDREIWHMLFDEEFDTTGADGRLGIMLASRQNNQSITATFSNAEFVPTHSFDPITPPEGITAEPTDHLAELSSGTSCYRFGCRRIQDLSRWDFDRRNRRRRTQLY